MKQYGPNGGVNRIKVTGPDFDLIRARILSKPDQVTDEIAEAFDEVGREAVTEMQERITSLDRIDTKVMYDSVDYIARKNKRSVSLRFGWIKGTPGYAAFQEYGVSNRTYEPMHALTDARLSADIKIASILRKL